MGRPLTLINYESCRGLMSRISGLRTNYLHQLDMKLHSVLIFVRVLRLEETGMIEGVCQLWRRPTRVSMRCVGLGFRVLGFRPGSALL